MIREVVRMIGDYGYIIGIILKRIFCLHRYKSWEGTFTKTSSLDKDFCYITQVLKCDDCYKKFHIEYTKITD
jgi:hypothetical protein